MNLKKEIFERISAIEKVELSETKKVELANLKEVESTIDMGWKKHAEGIDLIKKAVISFTVAYNQGVRAEKELTQIIKAGTDLGLDVSFAVSRLDMADDLKTKSEKNKNISFVG